MGKYAVYDSHERDYPFSSDSYKECEKWIKEHGNDIDMCVIPQEVMYDRRKENRRSCTRNNRLV